MKLTNGELYNAKDPLAELMNLPLPIQVSYRLAKLASALDPHMLVIEQMRAKLIQTYGEQDPEKPQQMRVSPQSEGFARFAGELGILMTEEVDIDFTPVELPSTLEGIKPSILMALDKFVSVGGTN